MKRYGPAIVIAIGLLLVGSQYMPKGCEFPSIPPIVTPVKKVTRVTYVYEKDTTAIPRPVGAALNKLNEVGIVATDFEEDTTDGDGQVPDQYKVALEAAKKAGLPCLVVQAGEEVLRTVRDPKTFESVIEAAK